MKKGMERTRRKRMFPALLSFLTITSLFLTACGSSSKSYDSARPMAVAETAAAAMGSGAERVMEADEYEAGAYADSAITGNTASDMPKAQNRKLIRTVNLTVETDQFDSLLKLLQDQISSLSGYVEQSNISGSSMTCGNQPRPRRASVTARIPSSNLDMFITQVEDGGNVTSRSESTEDVTIQYSDLESRKKTLTMEQDRIWALLEKADTLESVIALEERLSEIRYELESMESRLRLYDNQVDYSTVYLSIQEVTSFTPTAPQSVGERIYEGFTENLADMGDFLVNLFISLVTTIPIWLPLLLIFILIITLVRKLSKKKTADRSASRKPFLSKMKFNRSHSSDSQKNDETKDITK